MLSCKPASQRFDKLPGSYGELSPGLADPAEDLLKRLFSDLKVETMASLSSQDGPQSGAAHPPKQGPLASC
jgi:hypothetical protein